MAAWIWGNPPFASPDEWSHYIRAIGVGYGQIIGPRGAFPVPPHASARTLQSYRWINEATRMVRVPPHMYALHPDCNAQQPNLSAACLSSVPVVAVSTRQPTPVGNYQPLPYVLPGLLIHLAANPFAGDVWGRIGAAASCFLLLVLAVFLLWDASPISLLGILVAVSPMVLFLGASLNPSGLEVYAGIAFAAAILRLTRDSRATTWLAVGITGLILPLTRSPAPLWVGLDSIIALALLGPRPFGHRIRSGGRAAVLAVLLVALGIVLNQLWEHAYGSHLHLTLGSFLAQLGPGITQLQYVLQGEVGDFGSLDTPLPTWMWQVWWGMASGLILLAIWLGALREQLTVLGAFAGSLVLPILFSALLVAGTGFDVQGRHMLPVVVMVPLLAGEVVSRHRADMHPVVRRTLPLLVAALAALVQAQAWYWNARRQSVGAGGRFLFFLSPQWSPPLGWAPWLLLVAGGSALLFATLAAATFAPPRRRP